MSQPSGQPRIPMSRLQLPHPMSLQVFEDYEQAQRAVDYLSDREFPVQNVMIVGTDLKQVERVTGRITAGRVLASGAASGAWMGAFFGLLMWAFVQGGGAAQFLTAVIVGAVFGMIWALMIYRMTGGARDFTSVMQVVATRYEVLVDAPVISQARALLEDQRRGVPNDAGREPQSRGAGSVPPAASGAVHAPQSHGASAFPPPGAQPPAQAVPEPRAEQPRYRTYGEALDAERAARQHPEGGVAPQSARAAEPGTTQGATGDDSAAEDAHDVPRGDRPTA